MKALCILLLCAFTYGATGQGVVVGAAQTERYFPLLKNKRVAVVTNHTGMVGNKHLVDLLHESGVNVVVLMAPEHGFRGTADAGEHVDGSVDEKTGIPIRSLYDGKTTKPAREVMESFDRLVFDIQDVGTRFYTYYITLVRLMDACAEYGKEIILLDRPNPNGHYVDGPILDMKHKSGVGWLPIPVVHGMTLGELALMVNGEKWLPERRTCRLIVVPCEHYTHQTHYRLPVAPSPNLPNMKAVYLYPSLCYLEGTPVSLGRGTETPFQLYGHPDMEESAFTFTPHSLPGAKNPPLLGKRCYGVDLSRLPDSVILARGLDLSYVIDAYNRLKTRAVFFTPFFEKLIGVDYVRRMIEEGKSAEEIAAMWRDDVKRFMAQRRRYLLYRE